MLIPTLPLTSIITGVVSPALLSTLIILPEPLVDLTLTDSPEAFTISSLAVATVPIPIDPVT